MNVEDLHQFVASVPGSFGDHIARRIAVNMIAAGRADAGAALVGLVGLDAIPALAGADAPASVLQAAVENAVLYRYLELPAFIAEHGGRRAFAAWCRQAAFSGPETLPPLVDLYRGTMGVTPAVAATGLHWSLAFDDAAYFAYRFADSDLTGVHVIHARVPRDGIAAFISGSAHQEVVPAETPTVFEVISDKDLIGDAAVCNAHRMKDLLARGRALTGTEGRAEQVAMATRAQMAAAGMPRGSVVA